MLVCLHSSHLVGSPSTHTDKNNNNSLQIQLFPTTLFLYLAIIHRSLILQYEWKYLVLRLPPRELYNMEAIFSRFSDLTGSPALGEHAP